jgi:large repetitive protein
VGLGRFFCRVVGVSGLLRHRGGSGGATALSGAIASGAPKVPTHLRVTGANVAGGGTKAFEVSWQPVDPNGRGATHYHLFDHGRSVECAGRVWILKTSCTFAVSNDGSTHRFAVKAANDPGVPGLRTAVEGRLASHRSPSSTRITAVAAGMPTGFSNASLTPTGNNGQATLTLTVGASHGADGTVTCSPDYSCGSINVGKAGGSVTKTLAGLINGTPSSITLTYCNGAMANVRLSITPCVTTMTNDVTTYGPIGEPTVSATASGTAVTVEATADANGAAAHLVITDTVSGQSHDCGTADSIISCAWTEAGLDAATIYHYSASVTDASGNGRATTSATTTATTQTSSIAEIAQHHPAPGISRLTRLLREDHR